MALVLGWETGKHEKAQKKKILPAKAKYVAVINLVYLILSHIERSGV
jgi:hypothetical protein